MLTLVMLALAGGASASAEVTGAADDLRTGWYPDQPSLTPAMLSGGSFKQVFKSPLQGQIYAQPLTADGTLLVVSEDNLAYGLDPLTGTVRWEHGFGTPVNALEKPIECEDLSPHIGITGTPVIDTAAGVAYFVSTRYVTGSSGEIATYMHAIELSDGKEVPHFPVRIEGKAQNLPEELQFKSTQELQRPALLLMGGVVYAAFGSHCDKLPYEGWVAGVSTAGKLVTMWATGAHGGSIWQSGGGLVSDGPGQILLTSSNGSGAPAESEPPPGKGTSPPEGQLSDSVVRVAVQHETELKATDFFSPADNAILNEQDLDLGSGGPTALPSPYFGTASAPHLLMQVGKDGYFYLLNRDELGGMGQGPGGTDGVVQKLGPYGGVWDGSAVWPGDGGYLYTPAVGPAAIGGTSLLFFKYSVDSKTDEPELTLAATSPQAFGFGSGSPIVTSNGTSSGSAILWTTRCGSTCEGAELLAFNPVPSKGEPQTLWAAPIGTANKFSRPDAYAGHIYVGNREGDVYGYSAPILTPSATSLDLGTAPLKAQLTGEATFTNEGTPLRVSAVHAPPAPFEATGLPAPGSVIAPGQVITVKLAFRSSSPESFNGSLGLTTEAGETNISLSATAAAPPAPVSVTEPIPGSSAGSGLSQIASPLVSLAPIRAAEPPLRLGHLKLRASAARHGSASRVAHLSYTLSAAGKVRIEVYREVISHRCHRASTCVHYLPAVIKLTARGHRATNVLVVRIDRLPRGEYRLAATPISASGAPGLTRYVKFRTPA